jgi:hypothetical protein
MRWAILALLLVLVGCIGSGPQDTGVIDFRYGSQALEMRVIHGDGQRIFDGDTMSILLELRNRGTADISRGLLVVKGYDPQYLPNLHIEPSEIINIEGKDEFDPAGDMSQTVEITDFSVNAPTHKEILPQRLNIIGCYDYVSYGSYEVCVDPDPYNRRIENKVCQGGNFAAGAQGHPVAVTSIEEKVSKNDIRFNLRISNVGNGVVYDRSLSPEACAYDLDRARLNIIDVMKVELSGIRLECEPNNPVRMHEGSSTMVSCVCENCVNLDQGAYETVLNVELGYGYRNDIQTQIEIMQD